MIDGLNIIENAAMTEAGEPITVRRTWRDRLFSRPWRPMVATRIEVPRVPSRRIVRLGGDCLVMHPAIAAEWRAESKAAAAKLEHYQ